MKNFKKISLLAMGILAFQQINCSENSESLEFPQHTTEKIRL